ncbi:ABC transporter permease [Prochlorococcus sp. MIT 1341]|uniref:ABC transporter permease n=1 Tax=Prochlorococcus sp. MIT 1341 TaxID=3096221 RepID=UPI0039BF5B66
MNFYFNIIRYFWLTAIATELEYSFNFFVELVAVIANLFGSIFLLSLFYTPYSNLGGWSWDESLLVLGIYTFLEGITTSILQPNLSKIVQHVQNGTLDFVLLKPIDSQIWLSLRMFSPWGFPSVLCGVSLVLFSLFRSSFHINIFSGLLFLSTIISSLLILYSLWFLLATTSIWFVRIWNATEVLRSILVAGRYPVSSYPYVLRTIFTFILPIAFLTTVPAEVLSGRWSSLLVTLSLPLAFLFFYAARFFWLYALRFYTSASS